MASQLNWSIEFDLNSAGIDNAPQQEGVYEILQEENYFRYKGKTRVIEIGMSEKNLQEEIKNHLGRHTISNRIKRIRISNRQLSFRFAKTVPGQADATEKQLLKEFEDRHWDLPVFNSNRGYIRYEDKHYAK